MFKAIELKALERVEAVAEDDRIAILWRASVAAPGTEPFETLFFDLREFDSSVRRSSGTQFVDTAKLVEVMRPRAEA